MRACGATGIVTDALGVYRAVARRQDWERSVGWYPWRRRVGRALRALERELPASGRALVAQVQKATGYPYPRALEITYEAHTKGRAIVWAGGIEECLRVEGVLREIGLHTDIVA